MHPAQKAIESGSGRRFLGGFRTRYLNSNPPEWQQGDREVARRLRQEITKLAKSTIEIQPDGASLSLWDQLCGDPESAHKFRSAGPAALMEIRQYIREQVEHF